MQRPGVLVDRYEVLLPIELLHIQFLPMMNYGGNAVKEVFINTPTDSELLGDLQHLSDLLAETLMDIGSPFGIAGIDPAFELGEQIEIQVVV